MQLQVPKIKTKMIYHFDYTISSNILFKILSISKNYFKKGRQLLYTTDYYRMEVDENNSATGFCSKLTGAETGFSEEVRELYVGKG